MSKAPRVSVYVTNHNYGRFLAQAMDSVLNQTMQDFELIAIDDGSTDNSREVMEGYRSHPKVVIVFQENKGLNVTNNIALRAARGTYVIRLDADDWLDPHALEVMASRMDRDESLGLVFPDYYMADADGNVSEIVRRHDFASVEMFDQPAHGACTMARREFLLEVGGYDESFRCQDGWDIWMSLIQRYKVANVNLPLFYYRQHGRSLTRNEGRLLSTRGEILRKHALRKGRKLAGLGVIPVRGSKLDADSIALQPLGGRAVIDWTLDAAMDSEYMRQVAVTTPDEDVLAHVRRRYGNRVMPILRAPELARINTHIEDTILHALGEMNDAQADAVIVLYVECPFRSGRQIDMMIDTLDLFEADTVVGVRPETDIFYQHNGKGLVAVRSADGLRLEREEIYRGAGKLYAVRRSYLEQNRRMIGGRIGHLVIDAHAAIQLRDEWDFEVAQYWAGRLQEQGGAREGVA